MRPLGKPTKIVYTYFLFFPEVTGVLIPVIYADDSYDLVEDILLNELIISSKIKAFKRSSGWVRIGEDRVRKIDYTGPERRGKRL
jgi:hypothetical protein